MAVYTNNTGGYATVTGGGNYTISAGAPYIGLSGMTGAAAAATTTTTHLFSSSHDIGLDAPIMNPLSGHQIWVARLSVSNAVGKHHFGLFKKLHPEVPSFLIAASEHGGSQGLFSSVAFKTQKDADFFEKWFSEYESMFGEDLYEKRLPPPPCILNQSFQARVASNIDIMDIAFWIHTSCQNKVYCLSDRLFFENEEDALAFKLKWS